MSATNTVAEHIEAHGARTFSAKEMAFHVLGLMHPLLFSTRDNAADFQVTNGPEAENVMRSVPVTPRANFKFDFPKLESPESLADLAHLQGILDLDKVLVIAGFAEVGPWGSSRTRWEMEARGEFTIEGCIEMAWIMGYIKHFDGKLKNGNLYVGWVDAKTGEPVDDKDVKPWYEKEILTHSGIRLIGQCELKPRYLRHSFPIYRAGTVQGIRPEKERLQPRSRVNARPRVYGGIRGGG